MENYVEEKKNLLSDFNEAKFQIIRLHNSWVLCNNYRRLGKLTELKWELDTIWDEFSSKSYQKHGEETQKEIDALDKKIAEAKNKQEEYTTLRIKYRKLKLIQEDIGMGGRMSEEGKDLMDD